MTEGDLIRFNAEAGTVEAQLWAEGEALWIFQVEEVLSLDSSCKEHLQARTESARSVVGISNTTARRLSWWRPLECNGRGKK